MRHDGNRSWESGRDGCGTNHRRWAAEEGRQHWHLCKARDGWNRAEICLLVMSFPCIIVWRPLRGFIKGSSSLYD